MKLNSVTIILKNRVLQHTLFWIVSFYILLHLFASSDQIQKIDYIYTALFHISLASGVYVNLSILIPKLLSRKHYVYYILSLVVLMFACAGFNILTFDKLTDYILPGYYFISYYVLSDILKFVMVYLAVTSLLKLAKSWFALSEANLKLSQLQKDKTETELQALKSQINPHFLFNSMNGIYSLALKQSDKTPEIVLKLSDIMRYMIYETTADFVALKKEIKYLQDYVDLQKLRSDNRATIIFDVSGEPDGKQVAPLLFFPLIENSFKHGIKGETGKSFVTIHFIINDKWITCTIENNKGTADNVEKKEYKGIGLTNVRKRLDMIYPGSHTLVIKDSGEIYRVELTIPTRP